MNNKNTEFQYKATPARPFHLSVRAVVLNAQNKIICIKYSEVDQYKNVYSLMTETMINNETPTEAVLRGSKEELGYEIDALAFLGSTTVKDRWWGEKNMEAEVEKSILYFIARAISIQNVPTSPDTLAKDVVVVEKDIDELISIMKKQQVKDGMRDFNQLEILERVKTWMDRNTSN